MTKIAKTLQQENLMTRQEQSTAESNRHHQEQLAASLVNTLGVEGAMHACQANAWAGVLECVLARSRDVLAETR